MLCPSTISPISPMKCVYCMILHNAVIFFFSNIMSHYSRTNCNVNFREEATVVLIQLPFILKPGEGIGDITVNTCGEAMALSPYFLMSWYNLNKRITNLLPPECIFSFGVRTGMQTTKTRTEIILRCRGPGCWVLHNNNVILGKSLSSSVLSFTFIKWSTCKVKFPFIFMILLLSLRG